jgi:putative membrane protein
MAIVKTLHLVFMVSWFAGLFYLPRLFVYHALATDAIGIERFKIMERRLYRGIMTPSAVLTVVLIAHHIWLGTLLHDFAVDRNTHSDTFYRWINEIPALPLLAGIVYLVVAKPF